VPLGPKRGQRLLRSRSPWASTYGRPHARASPQSMTLGTAPLSPFLHLGSCIPECRTHWTGGNDGGGAGKILLHEAQMELLSVRMATTNGASSPQPPLTNQADSVISCSQSLSLCTRGCFLINQWREQAARAGSKLLSPYGTTASLSLSLSLFRAITVSCAAKEPGDLQSRLPESSPLFLVWLSATESHQRDPGEALLHFLP
jgi:hypothetical protein